MLASLVCCDKGVIRIFHSPFVIARMMSATASRIVSHSESQFSGDLIGAH